MRRGEKGANQRQERQGKSGGDISISIGEEAWAMREREMI